MIRMTLSRPLVLRFLLMVSSDFGRLVLCQLTVDAGLAWSTLLGCMAELWAWMMVWCSVSVEFAAGGSGSVERLGSLLLCTLLLLSCCNVCNRWLDKDPSVVTRWSRGFRPSRSTA